MTMAHMDQLEIVQDCAAWDCIDLEALAQKAVCQTLMHLGIEPAGHELAILAADDTRIAELNGTFREKAQPTNVLSWPAIALEPGAPPLDTLGDIALAYQTCAREAEAAGKPFEHHVLHLLVHATLHLLGYDHINEADAEKMENNERLILGKLGVPDPY